LMKAAQKIPQLEKKRNCLTYDQNIVSVELR
jgi:hypothetical protein